jgi:hypothetical protein
MSSTRSPFRVQFSTLQKIAVIREEQVVGLLLGTGTMSNLPPHGSSAGFLTLIQCFERPAR